MMHWTSSDQKIPEGKLTSASSFEICCPSREVAQTCQGGYPNPAIEGELAVQNVCGAVYGWCERVPRGEPKLSYSKVRKLAAIGMAYGPRA